jgi:sugar phosphate isomerase/epimerase
VQLVKAVDHPWFGVNLDFGNFRDPQSEFAPVAPYAVTTHAKVTHRDAEGNPRLVDYALARRVMEAVRYRGYLSIEFEEPQDPREGVPAFVAELKRVFH